MVGASELFTPGRTGSDSGAVDALEMSDSCLAKPPGDGISEEDVS